MSEPEPDIRTSPGAFITLYLFILCVAACGLIMPTFFIIALHQREMIQPPAVFTQVEWAR